MTNNEVRSQEKVCAMLGKPRLAPRVPVSNGSINQDPGFFSARRTEVSLLSSPAARLQQDARCAEEDLLKARFFTELTLSFQRVSFHHFLKNPKHSSYKRACLEEYKPVR